MSEAKRRKYDTRGERDAGKGRQPLSPSSTGETRSAVSAPDIGGNFRVARRSGPNHTSTSRNGANNPLSLSSTVDYNAASSAATSRMPIPAALLLPTEGTARRT